MKEDVSVRVCGVQRCPGAEEDVSELVCEGVFKHTADGWLLAYEEPSEAGTVKTLLRFADSRVTLTRRGAVAQRDDPSRRESAIPYSMSFPSDA